MGFALSLLSSGTFWKIVGGIVLLAAISYGVHLALEHFREQGRAEQKAIDAPIIAQFKADMATLEANQAALQAQIARQNTLVDDLRQTAAASQQQAAQAIARASMTAKAYQSQIDGLTAIANGPRAPSLEAACKETQDLLARLMTP